MLDDLSRWAVLGDRQALARIAAMTRDATGRLDTVVLEGHAFVHRHVVLDLDVVADDAARRHEHVLTEAAALADDDTRHDVAEMPDLRALPDRAGLVDERRVVGEIPVAFFHWTATRDALTRGSGRPAGERAEPSAPSSRSP